MIRFLNVVACGVLIGSAVYAYTIKYETIYRSEQLAKVSHQIKAERDAIGVLRAEWGYLTRPDRLQALSDKYLDLQNVKPDQIVEFAALPDRPQKVDSIGRKLEALGLGEPTSTPATGRDATSSTPASGAR